MTVRITLNVMKIRREIPYGFYKNKYAIVHTVGSTPSSKIDDALHVRNTTPISCRRSMSLSHTRHCVVHLHN